ncbi:MAG: nucleotidyltransferase domain-containing protein [Caldilineaceae bacterium]
MSSSTDIPLFAQQFDHPAVNAIVLMGSHARGDAGPYSDVDLVRFVAEEAADLTGAGSHLRDGVLVVISNATPKRVEGWFTDPEQATNTMAGLRMARALIDRHDTFAAIQARAHAFCWTEDLQMKADLWVSEQMVGWIEEVHKGLEGLRRRDPGRLLNASFGLSWGLSTVVKVQRGILLSGDNGFFQEITHAIGPDSVWSQLYGVAFGVAEVHGRPPSLRERVVAGLHLYALTADLIGPALQPEHAPLIHETVTLIHRDLEQAYHGER